MSLSRYPAHLLHPNPAPAKVFAPTGRLVSLARRRETSRRTEQDREYGLGLSAHICNIRVSKCKLTLSQRDAGTGLPFSAPRQSRRAKGKSRTHLNDDHGFWKRDALSSAWCAGCTPPSLHSASFLFSTTTSALRVCMGGALFPTIGACSVVFVIAGNQLRMKGDVEAPWTERKARLWRVLCKASLLRTGAGIIRKGLGDRVYEHREAGRCPDGKTVVGRVSVEMGLERSRMSHREGHKRAVMVRQTR